MNVSLCIDEDNCGSIQTALFKASALEVLSSKQYGRFASAGVVMVPWTAAVAIDEDAHNSLMMETVIASSMASKKMKSDCISLHVLSKCFFLFRCFAF